ncbi:Subtilisin precursor [Myxococcus hansupus]|uniref:Subtilisin n=1 Tax=Pseudomyxococcus hansupus TaxID=1297742 RepID=A0A0H4WXQ9_9BACT|nr:S8 family serine peptidase [Myxococcus hansupus]AKQ66398.1 Subtilisin precursor [Myxococcus hansupus]
MFDPNPFESPKLRTIDVILEEGCGACDLEKAVAELVGAEPWDIRPVPLEPSGREFDLIPQAPVSPERAWELTYALQKRPCVKDADPNFEAIYAEEDVALNEMTSSVPPSTKMRLETPRSGEFTEDDCDWSVRFVKAQDAWDLPDSIGRQGDGIRIGHPDSGYQAHAELGPNFNPALGWDFVDNDSTTENAGGGHGLSTASVISSPHDFATASTGDAPQRFVAGIAPKAEIIPLRVAKPTGFIPAPVLFNVGVDRLRDAIWFAIHRQVHVISISLGWIPNAGLHRAIQHAVRENIIVIAAAGNYTGPIVVWPAAYDEVVAMAACNARATPWTYSARGSAVDATGPGENVWTAQPENKVAKSSGTSHATATVAGIAALWLAHHGRDNLLARYQGGPPLAQVFRHVLRATCDSWPASKESWGAGLVNAKACLQHRLPAVSELAPLGTKDSGKKAADALTDTFSDLPKPVVQNRLAMTLGVDEQKAARIDAEYGRELRFWALTQPAFRHALQDEAPPTLRLNASRSMEEAALPPFSPSLKAVLR